jgi:hypothetical protein
MVKAFGAPFAFFFALNGCSNSSATTNFTPYTSQDTSVPSFVRASLVFLPQRAGLEGCTGTYGVFPWGTGIVTAGHCVPEDAKKGEKIQFCHSPSGKFERSDSLDSHPQCRFGISKVWRNDSAADMAFIETSEIPPGLKAAPVDLEPSFGVGDLVYAAGYGEGKAQGYGRVVLTTQKEREEWTGAHKRCLALKELCGEDMQQCKSEESSELYNCYEVGPLRRQSAEAPKLKETSYIFHLRGGEMKIATIDGKEEMLGGVQKSEGHVTAQKTDPNAPQSSAGDSGTSWWFGGRMIGVHFAGTSTVGGDTSIFRTLKYYKEKIPAP